TATRSTEASTQKGPEPAEKWMPERFAAGPDAKLLPFQGKQYYDKITRQMPNGQLVNLVLIRPQGAGDPRPFYMMETKVWNDLYAEFRKEGGPADSASKWKNDGGKLPAVGMTVTDAHRFSEWIGGKLPTTQQWDYAAAMSSRPDSVGAAIALSARRAA